MCVQAPCAHLHAVLLRCSPQHGGNGVMVKLLLLPQLCWWGQHHNGAMQGLTGVLLRCSWA
jgi:hypothetical protein